jgi:hypothetical protein
MVAAPAVRPTNEARIRAALWFAERGFGIFPVWSTRSDGRCKCPAASACSAPGKHPVTVNGFQDATQDEAKIRTFLTAGSDPNYGMVCPEGVFALDVDGEDGPARLAALEAQHGALPPTLRTETANGQHVFLRWPDGYPRPLRQIFGFVTRWGSGKLSGYVIGPRSIHPSGVEYRPVDGSFDIAELPATWAAAVAAPGVTVHGRQGPEDIRPGHRHDWLRDTARLYSGTVRDPDALFAAVWAENEKLDAPKSREEVERAIGDVLTKFPADPVEEDPETGVVRRVADDEVGLLPPTQAGMFPEPPDDVAFDGLLGECVYALAEGTDASLVGLLGSVTAFCGALIPGQAYFHRLQTSSPFVALVGDSSVGRKGTAMMRAFDAVSQALDPVYVNRAVLDGLNSGEGLVSTLHYKQTAFPYEPTVGLVFEEEYASLLASRGREGSTLDPKMRAAFDGGPLSNRKAGETKVVSPPYWLPALIAITPMELRHRLEPGALRSGSANRWLYLPVIRRESVPTNAEPAFTGDQRLALREARQKAIDARGRVLGVAPGVVARLAEYADFLPGASSGLAQDLSRRLSVIAFRVSLVHALAERAAGVTLGHLDRALALTEYSRRGIAWVFGETIGNRDAELLLRHLQQTKVLRTRAIAREIIRDPIRRMDAIDELGRLGYADVVTLESGTRGGRPGKELRLRREAKPFVPFVASGLRQNESTVHAQNGGFVGFDGVADDSAPSSQAGFRDRTSETRSDSVDKTATEPALNPDKTATERDRTGTWSQLCSDYGAHQSSHRNTPAGWTCDACYPPVPA